MFHNRKARYGWMTGILTVLLIAAVILANVLFGTLSGRYQWYTDLSAAPTYEVTEKCYGLIDSVFASVEQKTGKTAAVEIIFCDLPENLESSSTSSYVYHTANSLAERFPERIKVTCYDIWLNPNNVKQYMTSTVIDPETGLETEQPVPLKSTSVIIASEGYHRVYSQTEFFVFEGGNTSNVWAYNGEKKLAAGILHAVDPETHTVCLTNNHGEAYYDYEIIYLLDDAGYRLSYVDLYRDPLPESCDLLICFNPNKDLTVADGVSAVSETDILDAFLATPGHSLLVFLENGTPALPNFEAYLGTWGVSTCYHQAGNGTSFRYMVQDSTQSLTSDGYTIYGKAVRTGTSGAILEGLSRNLVFKNATALRTAQGYASRGDGSYEKGNRVLYDLYDSGSGAVSWANGNPVDGDPVMLMTLTEQKNAAGASSYVGVVASVDFASEEFLQSAVYGNTDAFLHLLTQCGKTYTPEGLTIKPFRSTSMSLVTTAEMLRWTVLLALIPAVAVTGIAVVVLIRRRHE